MEDQDFVQYQNKEVPLKQNQILIRYVFFWESSIPNEYSFKLTILYFIFYHRYIQNFKR